MRQLWSLWIWHAGKRLALNTPQNQIKAWRKAARGLSSLQAMAGGRGTGVCTPHAKLCEVSLGSGEVGEPRKAAAAQGDAAGPPQGCRGRAVPTALMLTAALAKAWVRLKQSGWPRTASPALRMELAMGSPLPTSFIEQRNTDRDARLRGVRVSPRLGWAGKKR